MSWTPTTPIRPATPILPALFSYSYVLPIFYPLCFDIHACNAACTPLPAPPTAYPHSLSPIPFLVIFLRTLLRSSKTQPLCFPAIPHSLAKTPGVGRTHEQDLHAWLSFSALLPEPLPTMVECPAVS